MADSFIKSRIESEMNRRGFEQKALEPYMKLQEIQQEQAARAARAKQEQAKTGLELIEKQLGDVRNWRDPAKVAELQAARKPYVVALGGVADDSPDPRPDWHARQIDKIAGQVQKGMWVNRKRDAEGKPIAGSAGLEISPMAYSEIYDVLGDDYLSDWNRNKIINPYIMSNSQQGVAPDTQANPPAGAQPAGQTPDTQQPAPIEDANSPLNRDWRQNHSAMLLTKAVPGVGKAEASADFAKRAADVVAAVHLAKSPDEVAAADLAKQKIFNEAAENGYAYTPEQFNAHLVAVKNKPAESVTPTTIFTALKQAADDAFKPTTTAQEYSFYKMQADKLRDQLPEDMRHLYLLPDKKPESNMALSVWSTYGSMISRAAELANTGDPRADAQFDMIDAFVAQYPQVFGKSAGATATVRPGAPAPGSTGEVRPAGVNLPPGVLPAAPGLPAPGEEPSADEWKPPPFPRLRAVPGGKSDKAKKQDEDDARDEPKYNAEMVAKFITQITNGVPKDNVIAQAEVAGLGPNEIAAIRAANPEKGGKNGYAFPLKDAETRDAGQAGFSTTAMKYGPQRIRDFYGDQISDSPKWWEYDDGSGGSRKGWYINYEGRKRVYEINKTEAARHGFKFNAPPPKPPKPVVKKAEYDTKANRAYIGRMANDWYHKKDADWIATNIVQKKHKHEKWPLDWIKSVIDDARGNAKSKPGTETKDQIAARIRAKMDKLDEGK